jgi:hypothetical protein
MIHSPDVCFNASLFIFLCASIESNVDGLVGCGFLGVEILDESRIGVKIGACGIPENFV